MANVTNASFIWPRQTKKHLKCSKPPKYTAACNSQLPIQAPIEIGQPTTAVFDRIGRPVIVSTSIVEKIVCANLLVERYGNLPLGRFQKHNVIAYLLPSAACLETRNYREGAFAIACRTTASKYFLVTADCKARMHQSTVCAPCACAGLLCNLSIVMRACVVPSLQKMPSHSASKRLLHKREKGKSQTFPRGIK